MIIVRRIPLTVKKIQRKITTGSSSSSTMSTPSMGSLSGVDTGDGTASSCGSSSGSSSPVTGAGSSGGAISFDWTSALSAENKQRTIEVLSFDRDSTGFDVPWDDLNYRKAAVLVPLCYDLEGQPSLLYNLRSATLSKHKGEISFPGGSLDPEDRNDPVVAALRETHEELGIEPEAVDIWTSMRIFPTISSNMGVIPVLGFIKKDCIDPRSLQVNPDEVDHAFTVSLKHLCEKVNWGEGKERKHKGKTYNMPQWRNLKVFNGTEEIHLWGLTAFITHLTLIALLPTEVYTRGLPYLTLESATKSIPKSEAGDDSSASNSNVEPSGSKL
jgi:nudix motif 8